MWRTLANRRAWRAGSAVSSVAPRCVGEAAQPRLVQRGVDDLQQRPHQPLGQPRVGVGLDPGRDGHRLVGQPPRRRELHVRAHPVGAAGGCAQPGREPLGEPALHAARRHRDQLGRERIRERLRQQRGEGAHEPVGPLGSVDVQHGRSHIRAAARRSRPRSVPPGRQRQRRWVGRWKDRPLRGRSRRRRRSGPARGLRGTTIRTPNVVSLRPATGPRRHDDAAGDRPTTLPTCAVARALYLVGERRARPPRRAPRRARPRRSGTAAARRRARCGRPSRPRRRAATLWIASNSAASSPSFSERTSVHAASRSARRRSRSAPSAAAIRSSSSAIRASSRVRDVDLAREHDRGGRRAADHRRVRALERDRLELRR